MHQSPIGHVATVPLLLLSYRFFFVLAASYSLLPGHKQAGKGGNRLAGHGVSPTLLLALLCPLTPQKDMLLSNGRMGAHHTTRIPCRQESCRRRRSEVQYLYKEGIGSL